MLNMDLLWSSDYTDNICEKYYDCEYCDEDCLTFNGDIPYDLLDDLIDEDFMQKFDGISKEYMIVGVDSINYYSNYLKSNVDGYSDLFDSVRDIVDLLCDGDCIIRIYKEKYNHVLIERSHHDGKEYFMLCRLSKQGYEYLDKGYDFDRRKYLIKSVFKDFDFFN